MSCKFFVQVSFSIFITFLFVFSFSSKVFALTTNQSADLILGQDDFLSGEPNKGGSVTQNSIQTAYPDFSIYGGGMSTYGDYIFLADGLNNRVLIWNSIDAVDGNADLVLGQANFTDAIENRGGSADDDTLSYPTAVFYDGVNLFVSDSGNHRILIWNGLPTTNGEAADLVLGQANFSGDQPNRGTFGADAEYLNSPEGLYSDGTHLFSADNGNSRVLIWNTVPTTNGQEADVVVGQEDFTTRQCNRLEVFAFPDTTCQPHGVAFDGTKLYVSDTINNRVLIWNNLPTTNGEDADVVIGQENFSDEDGNKGGSDPTIDSLYSPHALLVTGSKLYVTDPGNNRVLRWNSIPTTNGADASVVIGQENFTSRGINKNGTIGASTLRLPRGIGGTANRLFVLDLGNNRILGYTSPTEDSNSDSDDDDNDEDDEPEVCSHSKPQNTSWIKLKPTTQNGVKGLYATWTQYGANNVVIKIDDGTGTFPWRTEKLINDGHEFLPNVDRSQKIVIRPYYNCREGDLSSEVSYNLFPFGWFAK
jgi:hypothetical protein